MAKTYRLELENMVGRLAKLTSDAYQHEFKVYYGKITTEGSSLNSLIKNASLGLYKDAEATNGIDSVTLRHMCNRHQAMVILAIEDEFERLQALKSEKQRLTIDGVDVETGSVWTTTSSSSTSGTLDYAAVQRAHERLYLRDLAPYVYQSNPFMALTTSESAFSGSEVPVPLQYNELSRTVSQPAEQPSPAPVARRDEGRDFEPSLDYVQARMLTDIHLPAGTRHYTGDIFYIGSWRCAPGSTWSSRELRDLYSQLEQRDRRLGRFPEQPEAPFQPDVAYLYSNYSRPGINLVRYEGHTFSFEGTNLMHGAVVEYQHYFALVDRINAAELQRNLGAITAPDTLADVRMSSADFASTYDSNDDEIPF